ncbi:tail protein [Paracoccus phage ParKuw1]|uniref:Tail protein n=1 Tax=Paracoccus phage ParKuw1 TaxID=3032415 RepID=A0AAF0FKV8_9CAUD|nr:tail protein [Paracoccus phage ParKuw1]
MYTRLDIINEMIVSTGARPLTAEQSRHPLYMKAEQLLERVTASVQSLGLWFNTECREITQQSNGEVIVPSGCIKADPVDRRYNLTLRGRRMYDLDSGDYEINENLTLKMIFKLDLEEMPLAAMEYIRAKAVYEFYLNEDGADPKLGNYRNERDRGWQALYREHIRNRQQNIFDNPSNAVTSLRRGVGYGRWKPKVN